MALKISSRKVGDVAVVVLEGRLIFEHCGSLREALKRLLTAGKKKVVLNLAEVSYCDSAGLGSLASSFASVQNFDGTLKLAGVHGKVREVLQLTRLDMVIEIYPTEAEALAGFN